MKQRLFEQQNTALWNELETLLTSRKKGDRKQLPKLYRAHCQTLALAKQRGYSPSLTQRLHTLALNAHQQLYGTALERPALLRYWLMQQFPRLVREEWRLLLVGLCAFWGVALTAGFLVWAYPDLVYSIATPEELLKYKAMYSQDAERFGRGSAGSDLLMFGFYIWNNVSICFRTFAGGIFGGIPALLSLASNGLHGGVVAGYLSGDPVCRKTFWSFVITHSAFEITGLILSGLAGMRMGLTLISPGPYSRPHALTLAGRRILPVLVGAAAMTVIAAFIEAFWSAMPGITAETKYLVGGLTWMLVIFYFLLAGRRHAD